MSSKASIAWFKHSFGPQIAQAIAGTPICENILSAIALQETGYLWGGLIGNTSVTDILRICAGDTIDAPGRSAFPKSRSELEARKDGVKMFQLARKALVEVYNKTGQYGSMVQKPNKFCHGFGIFQYDLQFFKEDPEYFLEEQWHSFDHCLAKAMEELRAKLRKVFGAGKTTLTDLEKAYLAIAYNSGSFNPAKGLKQGYKNDEGEYYGELVYAFYNLAKTVQPAPADISKNPVFLITAPARPEPIVSLPGSMEPPAYPGKLLERNSSDAESVRAIQKRLRMLGYTESNAKGEDIPLSTDGQYGMNTMHAVELFQFRHTDNNGRALVVDGAVGSATWSALFGVASLPTAAPPVQGTLAARVVEVAIGETGVMEVPPGSNKGPRVEEYLASVGLDGGEYWCAAFVYWCFRQAAKDLGVKNPAIRTGGVLEMWNKARTAGFRTVTVKEATDNPSLVSPGMVFVFATGGGHGHTGLVTGVSGIAVETIEGNTDPAGSSNGIGVFPRTRSIPTINYGFIDFSQKV